MPATTRIYAVGSISGHEAVWRKFVNVLALDIYKVDVAIVLDAISDPAWLRLADERLADGPVVLSVVAAAGVVWLADGRPVPVAPGAPTLPTEELQEHRPALALCGGSPGTAERKFWDGDTLCLDPGSDAAHGGLAAYVADLGPKGVMVARHART